MRRCIAQGQTRRLRALLAALDPLLVCDSAAGSRGARLCPICHELLHPDTSNAQLYSGVGGDVYFISFQAAAHGSRVIMQHRDYVKAVCYSRGLRSFMSVGLDRRMILWDLQSLQEVRCTMYEGHTEVRRPPLVAPPLVAVTAVCSCPLSLFLSLPLLISLHSQLSSLPPHPCPCPCPCLYRGYSFHSLANVCQFLSLIHILLLFLNRHLLRLRWSSLCILLLQISPATLFLPEAPTRYRWATIASLPAQNNLCQAASYCQRRYLPLAHPLLACPKSARSRLRYLSVCLPVCPSGE